MRLSQRYILTVLILVPTLLVPARAEADPVRYLHTLADFSGTVPYNDVHLYVDQQRDEVYASVGNTVRIFNSAGMEVYQFEHDSTLGSIYDLAVDETGDIFFLTLQRDWESSDIDWAIARCDYRGDPVGRITIDGLPPELASFVPNVMRYMDGRFVLVSKAALRVVVADRSGTFQTAYDLAALIDIEDGKRGDNDMFGFDLDADGNMIFTIPTLFKVFVVSPDETVKAFGRPGSVPGAFGIASGIVGDQYGNLLVADKLRRVVMVFDKDLQFVREFGASADRLQGLVRPTELALSNSGKLYVTQARNRGVAVFKLNSGGEETRSNAGPHARGGVVRGGDTSNVPGQSGSEVASVFGQPTRPPVTPFERGGNTRQTDPADPRMTGMPEPRGGEQ